MIVSEQIQVEKEKFQQLLIKMDRLLNSDAKFHEEYYKNRNGLALESDVFGAINECAKGTEFQGTIQLVSGASFPDIIAYGYFGIEVKSTNKNHWTSIGSSILESTRNQSIEKIYLTFGKLGTPIQFKTRPYEKCLSGISVTHYPRYQIDMQLPDGETIFDKIGIPYDELRQLDDPIAPVSQYYKSKLKPGESLWWINNATDTVAPPTVRLWSSLTTEEKEYYTVLGYILFPETLGSKPTKYNRYTLWLATQKGIIHSNARDSFSAGGQVYLPSSNGMVIPLPAVYGKIDKHKTYIAHVLEGTSNETLQTFWDVDNITEHRLGQWIELISQNADSTIGYGVAKNTLLSIFNIDF